MSAQTAKIAIVGGGAMGSVFAGLFAEAGHEVTIVSRPGAHMDAIRANGLRLDGASGDKTVQVRALDTSPSEEFDLVILAVKATQVEAAVGSLAPMMGEATSILAMQNGLGAADIIAGHVDAHRLAVGIAAAFGASVVSPGHAHHTGMGAIKIGAYLGMTDEKTAQIADLWCSASFKAEAVSDILTMQWEKLICNASFSAPCAITGLTVGEALTDPALGSICLQAGIETWEIARACGVPLTVTDAEAHVRAFAERVAAAKPSLLQDVEAGRPSEIDFINGAVPREAAKMGLKAPVNQTLTALVKAIEAKRGA
ncbi:MAG: 2-dehydropantoate 2-reductase [Alphaproteobacteria bacterium]|nr:2-dehydropantoate 2-reductase [Alphaproteobacteria bacterium]|tara:strand:- start:4791 stop:5726 length:936 start_codon:yes stop_codon:yes gene_type:complete